MSNFAAPVHAQSIGLGKGGWPLEPYDIDYSGLSDPSRRVDILDKIRYIPTPLSASSYLTLGGEFRQQAWWQNNEAHGLRAPNQNRYDLSRAIAYAYLHIDRHFAGFLEIGRYDAWSKINPSTTDKGRGRIQQGFLELQNSFGATSVDAKLGRQEIMLGSGRFVWINDSSNIRTVHDGVRVHLDYASRVSLDLVGSEPTVPTTSSFSDWKSHNGSFAAVYASEVIAPTRMHFDQYYFFRKNIGGQYAGLTGNEDRHTLGTRLWGQSTSGALQYDGEIAYQWGNFNPHKVISAVGSSTRVLYTFQSVPYTPGLQLQTSYFSGSSNKNTIRTFSAPFPRATLLNYAGIDTLENVWEVAPALLVNPVKSVSLRFSPEWLWRASVHDAIYISRSTPLAGTISATDTAAFIGTNLITSAQWKIRPGVTLFAEYLHELPGPAVTRAKSRGGSDIGVVQLDINI